MDRPPFFAFYPADFAGDINVEAMSTIQVGAYMLLLCKAWQAEPPASLPNDDQILARLARVDAVTWAEIKLGVLVPFRVGADGRLHSRRLRLEYDNALKRMNATRDQRSGAARSRWGKMRPASGPHPGRIAVAPLPHCDRNAIEIRDREEEVKTEESSEVAKPPHSEPPVMTFPCVGTGGKEWHLSAAKLEEWRASFPAVSVVDELRKARQWLLDNPKRGKTAPGMSRFLGSWLGRAQDRGAPASQRTLFPLDNAGRLESRQLAQMAESLIPQPDSEG